MRIINVSELTAYLRTRIEEDPFLANVWVRGEVSNCHYHPSGHLYFSLRDKYTTLGVVMFRSRVRQCRFRVNNGMAVVVRGAVGFYDRDNRCQLYAEELEPEGLGALHAALEQLKERLAAEGLFDEARKKPIPRFPSRIGLVTSPVGAAYKDVLTVAAKRWPQAEIVVAPVSVQGDTAPREIAGAIAALNRAGNVDVIIVGRGGGSIEELWAFNTETVARAVAASAIPVVSAVGHEKDVTIADLVADRRAATPSAAAELVCPDQAEVRYAMEMTGRRLQRSLTVYMDGLKRALRRCTESRAMARPLETIIALPGRRLEVLELRQSGAMGAITRHWERNLAELAGRLESLSPLATLARGYSICYREEERGERLLRDAGQVRSGERIKVRLHRGRLRCRVEEAEN